MTIPIHRAKGVSVKIRHHHIAGPVHRQATFEESGDASKSVYVDTGRHLHSISEHHDIGGGVGLSKAYLQLVQVRI